MHGKGQFYNKQKNTLYIGEMRYGFERWGYGVIN